MPLSLCSQWQNFIDQSASKALAIATIGKISPMALTQSPLLKLMSDERFSINGRGGCRVGLAREN
jgi:hypothetical protein